MPRKKSSKDSAVDHRVQAAKKGPTSIAVVTVSDSRTESTDISGQFLMEQIKKTGHKLAAYKIVKDNVNEVEEVLDQMVQAKAKVIVINGGTGISPRDTTYDAIVRKLEKYLPGFGELFRMLSYQEVGAAAMLSRATAGVYLSTIVFSVPGSPKAVRLAWEKLIAPELQHLTWELTRKH